MCGMHFVWKRWRFHAFLHFRWKNFLCLLLFKGGDSPLENQILLHNLFISNSALNFCKIFLKNSNFHVKDSIFSSKFSQEIHIRLKNPNVHGTDSILSSEIFQKVHIWLKWFEWKTQIFHAKNSIYSSKFPRKYTFEWKTVAIRARPSKHKILHRKQPLKRL